MGVLQSFLELQRDKGKGFPLSPLLFLLIAEALSLLVKKVVDEGKLKGVSVATLVRLTHLLFVDDVLLCRLGFEEEWFVYKEILNLLCSVSIMSISILKSFFLKNEISTDLENYIGSFFSL